MNYRFLTVAALLASGLVGNVSAQSCPIGTQQVTDIPTWIGGKTLCASSGSDRWQEFHSGALGGPLIDWKLGSGHPVDPTETVGTWSVGTGGVLTHAYTGGSSYSWIVCRPGNSPNHALVSTGASTTITGATVRSGQGSCN